MLDSYDIKRLYHENNRFVLYQVFQICLILISFFLIANDTINHRQKNIIQFIEIMIFSCLIIDVAIYLAAFGFKVTFLIIFELTLVIGYLVVFFMCFTRPINKEMEEFEFLMGVIRMVLLISRAYTLTFRTSRACFTDPEEEEININLDASHIGRDANLNISKTNEHISSKHIHIDV